MLDADGFNALAGRDPLRDTDEISLLAENKTRVEAWSEVLRFTG